MYLCTMKRKIPQKIADSIINKIAVATDPQVIKFNYDFGIWFDDFCINRFNIYLD